jgi:chromosome partitioning protein
MHHAKIVSVYNHKGGCGKTTTAVNLAAYAAINGLRTFLADIDPQESASAWIANADRDSPFPADYESMSVTGDKFDLKVEKYAKSGNYDLIIIDCPPAINNKLAQTALMISDAVVIPSVPSPIDLHATDSGFELIQLVKRMNKRLKVLRLNTMIGRSNLAKSIIDNIRETSTQSGYVMLENGTTNRSCYAETVYFGKGIVQMKPSEVPKKAVEEVENFCEEILSYVFDVSEQS